VHGGGRGRGRRGAGGRGGHSYGKREEGGVRATEAKREVKAKEMYEV
jgi:hypothetical protein